MENDLLQERIEKLKKIREAGINPYPYRFEVTAKTKALVEKYTNVASLKLRNIIAGYTARLVKQKTVLENQPRRRVHEEDLSKYYE